MVREVSATLVATTMKRLPAGGASNTLACADLGRLAYKGSTWTRPVPCSCSLPRAGDTRCQHKIPSVNQSNALICAHLGKLAYRQVGIQKQHMRQPCVLLLLLALCCCDIPSADNECQRGALKSRHRWVGIPKQMVQC